MSSSSWLDPVRRVIDGLAEPRTVFVRDDDAGWGDGRLIQLLDTLMAHEIVPDVAVIPRPDSGSDARPGLSVVATGVLGGLAEAGLVRLHQHGWRHVNHEATGRTCEFGASRDRSQQTADIMAGAEILDDLFGPVVDRLFTPPWNRCTADTGRAMLGLGLTVLSRDVSACSLGLDGLVELPVSVDWFGRRRGVYWDADERGRQIARSLRERQITGIMLHHAVTDDGDRDNIGQLAALLSGAPAVDFQNMTTIAQALTRVRVTQ